MIVQMIGTKYAQIYEVVWAEPSTQSATCFRDGRMHTRTNAETHRYTDMNPISPVWGIHTTNTCTQHSLSKTTDDKSKLYICLCNTFQYTCILILINNFTNQNIPGINIKYITITQKYMYERVNIKWYTYTHTCRYTQQSNSVTWDLPPTGYLPLQNMK